MIHNDTCIHSAKGMKATEESGRFGQSCRRVVLKHEIIDARGEMLQTSTQHAKANKWICRKFRGNPTNVDGLAHMVREGQ